MHLQVVWVYIKADRLIDVDKGRSVTNPLVMIENGKITQLGTQGDMTIPKDAEIVDLSGHTILPGLIDMHVHLTSEGVANGPWAVRAAVRRNIKYGADMIKFCATGGVLSKGTKVGVQQYSQQEMNALVAEAKLRGLTVAAHAHGTEGIKAAIKAGVTSVEHASFLDKEAIKLARKNGTYLSLDIYVTEYILGEGEKVGILQESLDKERTVGGRQRESFKQAVEAGVKMIFGSDAGVYPHGDNARQLSRMVKFGMTSMQALQAATINSARALGKSELLGSVAKGKYADIIAVKGNPLDDISILENVDVVIKQGKIVKQ